MPARSPIKDVDCSLKTIKASGLRVSRYSGVGLPQGQQVQVYIWGDETLPSLPCSSHWQPGPEPPVGGQNIFGNVVGQGKRAAAAQPGVGDGVGSSHATPSDIAGHRPAPHPRGGQQLAVNDSNTGLNVIFKNITIQGRPSSSCNRYQIT